MIILQPGTQFGPYLVVRRLGEGGMGAVYAAQTPEGHEVALKLLDLEGASEEILERFQREAEAHARVDTHPHVVRIHSAGSVGRQPYLVTDLLSGGDLAQRLRGGPISPSATRALGLALAGGLAHVHSKGVLHRDVKPANVLFDSEGRPCLADFGLARSVEATSLTQSGVLLGTPGYMAPEQTGEGEATAASDVFGLAATLYAALSGRAPFTGSTLLATLDNLLNAAPPRLPAHVPPDLRAAISRGLEKDPRDRFPDAESFAQALSVGEPGPRRSWPVVVFALGFLLMSGAVAAFAWLTPAKPLGPSQAPTTPISTSTPSPAPVPWIDRPVLIWTAENGRATCAWAGPDRILILQNPGVLRAFVPGPRGVPEVDTNRRLPEHSLGKWSFLLTGESWFASGGSGQGFLYGDQDQAGPLILAESPPFLPRDFKRVGDRYLMIGSDQIGLWRPGSPHLEWRHTLAGPSAERATRAGDRLILRGLHVLAETGPVIHVLVSWGPRKTRIAMAFRYASRLQELRLTKEAVEVVESVPLNGVTIRTICGAGRRLYLGSETGTIWRWERRATEPRYRHRASLASPDVGLMAHMSQIRATVLGRKGTVVSLGSAPPVLCVWAPDDSHVSSVDLASVGVKEAQWLRLSPDRRHALIQGHHSIALVPLPVK